MNAKLTSAICAAVLSLIALGFIIGCGVDDPLPPPPDQLKPLSPANLTAVALSSDSILLGWEDRSHNEQGFEIYERGGYDTAFSILTVITTPNVISRVLPGKIPATRYAYYIRAYNQGEKSDLSNVALVTTPDVPPKAPADLQGTLQADDTILLTWADSSNNELGFRIERQTAGAGSWIPAGTVNKNITQFTDNSGVEPNTSYKFRVLAFNEIGTSAPSNECVVNPPPTEKPTAPEAKYAQAISSSRIDFVWEPTGTNHSGFTVSRKISSEAWTAADTFNFAFDINLFEDKGLSPETGYDYRLTAYNEMGRSPLSEIKTAQTPKTNLDELIAPSNLSAVVVSSTSISLTWKDNSSDELGFKIERKELGGIWGELTDCAANDTSYIDTNLKPRIEYSYRVKAYKGVEVSPTSNVASAIPRIASPQNLTATAKSATKIELQWQDNCTEELGFRIERKLADNPWILMASTAQGVTSLTDTDLVPSTSYCYQIRAFNAKDTSDSGTEAVCETEALGVPTNLTALSKSTTRLDLTWVDNSGEDETGFVLQRHPGDSKWTDISLSANDTTYSDVGLTPNTTYTYRIHAVCKAVVSANSEETSASTSSLAAPANLTVTAQSSTSGLLKWEDRSYDETGFKIERKIGDGAWTALDSTEADTLTYLDSGLTPDVTYNYRVWAFQLAVTSDSSSNEAPFTPFVPVPSNVTGNGINTSSIKISWTDNSLDESGFKIERKEAGGDWAEVKVTDPNVTNFLDSGLKPETEYSYKLRAYIPTGTSVYSNDAVVSTKAIPAPSNVVATAKSSTTVELTWQDSNEELGYKIERWISGEEWTEVKVTEADAMVYLDTGLPPNTEYQYRIRAFHATGTSRYSDAVAAITNELLAPSELKLTPIRFGTIELSWKDNSGEEEGFKIERKSGEEDWSEIKIVAANDTVFADTGLVPLTVYTYRVQAYLPTGVSAYSNEAFSTTSGMILFVRGNPGKNFTDICTMNEIGTDISVLYKEDTNVHSLATWSPDKSMIAYSANRGGPLEVVIMNSQGGNNQQITDNHDQYGSCGPQFKSDLKIWFFRGPSGGKAEFYEMGIDGSNQTAITNFGAQGKQINDPRLSFGLDRIFYAKQNPSNSNTLEIYSGNYQFGAELQLTTNGVYDAQATISPDGQTILFLRGSNLWRMNSDGSQQTQLTNSNYSYPLWALDGKSLIISYYDATQWDILRMNPDGSNVVNITNTNNINEMATDWRE